METMITNTQIEIVESKSDKDEQPNNEQGNENLQTFLDDWNSENATNKMDWESLTSLRDGNIITARKIEKFYEQRERRKNRNDEKTNKQIRESKERRKNIMEEIYKQNPAKQAWLSLETTINEININHRYFGIEGWLTVFWQDNDFDKHNYLHQLSVNDHNYYNTKIIEVLLNGEDEQIKGSVHSMNDKQQESDSHNDKKEDYKIEELLKVDEIGDGFEIWTATNGKHGKQKYIQMGELLIDSNTKYSLPFDSKKVDGKEREWLIFSNALEFELLGANSLSVHYNINNHVFKMHFHFKTKCYECFENNDHDFPFEWQFLNMQMPYKIHKYEFRATIPPFVKSAFCFRNYWANHAIWERCISVRMKGDVDHWELLDPWVDLRRARDDYDYNFGFGLIKYRVRRDPTYYILNIIAPLFLMELCAFAVFMIDCNYDCSGRFSYIVGLLLAIAAFQISVELSYQSEFTLIDHYFLLAYVILTAFVLEAVLVQTGWRWEIDSETIDFWFCLVFGVIWLIYSFKFVFKYCIFAADVFECPKFTKRMCCDGIIGCFGCIKSFGVCMCVTLSCCKEAKRKERLKHWMRMEKAEAASWDNAKTLIETSKTAELVFGTRGDVFAWNQGVDHGEKRKKYLQYYESYHEGTVDLKLREEIVGELLKEE